MWSMWTAPSDRDYCDAGPTDAVELTGGEISLLAGEPPIDVYDLSPAAKLLDATEDLFILDTRDWDAEADHSFEWREETGAARLSWLGWTTLGTLIAAVSAWLATLTMGPRG